MKNLFLTNDADNLTVNYRSVFLRRAISPNADPSLNTAAKFNSGKNALA